MQRRTACKRRVKRVLTMRIEYVARASSPCVCESDLAFEHIEGVPVLAGVCATVAAAIEARHDCGDHSLIIGQVVGMRDGGRAPLVYHGGKYASLHYKTQKPADPVIDFWELEGTA